MKATVKTGLDLKAGAFHFDKAILITTAAASWANDVKIVAGQEFPRRSQFGRIHLLGDPCLWNQDGGHVRFIAMLYGAEASDNIRAMIVSLRGKLPSKNWEKHCASR